MTKHYGLFYTEPTQSLIPHLELLNFNEDMTVLKQAAEKFGLKHSNEKLLWDDLTYWSNEDFAYMILEVEIYDLKTVFVNYQNQIRYFKTIHDYDNYDEWEEIEITNDLKVEKSKRTVWVALQPCDDPYYTDNIIFIEESKEKIKEVCEKRFNKSSNDWYDRVVFEDEEEKIINHELKGTNIEIKEVEMGVEI